MYGTDKVMSGSTDKVMSGIDETLFGTDELCPIKIKLFPVKSRKA